MGKNVQKSNNESELSDRFHESIFNIFRRIFSAIAAVASDLRYRLIPLHDGIAEAIPSERFYIIFTFAERTYHCIKKYIDIIGRWYYLWFFDKTTVFLNAHEMIFSKRVHRKEIYSEGNEKIVAVYCRDLIKPQKCTFKKMTIARVTKSE